MHLPCLALALIMITASLTCAHPKLEKLRRGSSGLVPFPRVGRGGGGGVAVRTWEVAPDEFFMPEPESLQKRQLYAFPRIGRSELVPWSRLPAQLQLQELENLLLDSRARTESGGEGTGGGGGGGGVYTKRNSESSGNMWFGPRLGRSSERDVEYDDESTQKASTSEQGYPERADQPEKRKRRQTDSD